MMPTNFTIQSSSTSVTVVQGTSNNCLAILENIDQNAKITNAKMVTLDVNGNSQTYECKTLHPLDSANPSASDNKLFVALDESVTHVEVHMDGQLVGSPVAIALSHNAVAVLADGTVSQPQIYTSTSHTVIVTNDTDYPMQWNWSQSGTTIDSGTIAVAPSSPILLTSGNGILMFTWTDSNKNIFTTGVDVYDTTQNLVTIIGTISDAQAQPVTVTPSSGQVQFVNATSDDSPVHAWWLGNGSPSNSTQVPGGNTGAPVAFQTSDAPISWYLKWEDPGDPKVIVKRPAPLTADR